MRLSPQSIELARKLLTQTIPRDRPVQLLASLTIEAINATTHSPPSTSTQNFPETSVAALEWHGSGITQEEELATRLRWAILQSDDPVESKRVAFEKIVDTYCAKADVVEALGCIAEMKEARIPIPQEMFRQVAQLQSSVYGKELEAAHTRSDYYSYTNEKPKRAN
jgi:hypothetical protein